MDIVDLRKACVRVWFLVIITESGKCNIRQQRSLGLHEYNEIIKRRKQMIGAPLLLPMKGAY